MIYMETTSTSVQDFIQTSKEALLVDMADLEMRAREAANLLRTLGYIVRPYDAENDPPVVVV